MGMEDELRISEKRDLKTGWPNYKPSNCCETCKYMTHERLDVLMYVPKCVLPDGRSGRTYPLMVCDNYKRDKQYDEGW